MKNNKEIQKIATTIFRKINEGKRVYGNRKPLFGVCVQNNELIGFVKGTESGTYQAIRLNYVDFGTEYFSTISK